MRSSHLKLAGRIVVSAGLIAWLGSHLDWRALFCRIAGLDPRWLLLVAVLSPLCIVLLSYRWRLFLRARGVAIPFVGVLRVMWGGQFCNTFLPGAVGGDIYKAVAAGRLQPQAWAEVAATVVLDRFCALLTLGVLALAGLGLERAPLQGALIGRVAWPRWLAPAMAAAALAAVIAAAIFWRWSGRKEAWRKIRRVGPTLLAGLRDWPTLAAASAVAFAIHLANFGVFYALAHALHLGISFGQTLLIMPVVLLVAMLPVTINGHGLREVLLIAYFRWLNLKAGAEIGPAEAAVALSLLYVANDLLWNLPGGLWLVLRQSSVTAEP